MTSVFDSPRQQSPTINIGDDHNMETLLFNYLQGQPPLRRPPAVDVLNETLASYTVESHSSIDLLLPTQQTFINRDNLNTNDPMYLNDNLFQSPQLPFQDQQQQSLVINVPVSYFPSTTELQSQQTPQSLDTWNGSIIDILQATADLDNMYQDTSMDFNNNLGMMDTPFLDEVITSSNDINGMNTMDSTKSRVNLQVNSFTDLKNALESYYGHIEPSPLYPDETQRKNQSRRNSRITLKLVKQEQEQQQLLPVAVRETVESTSFLAILMEKARSHWCCVGFKVAPITLDVIQNWRQAPITIVYCVASIALVTFMDHDAGQSFVKSAAMEFYEQARRKMDDIVFDDENDRSNYDIDDEDDSLEVGIETSRQKAMTIQSYFCLSYTSNLLRLYEQQRTWGGLASIALQLRTKDAETGCRPMDEAILFCFCRWYYVDAWMALTLQRECLLPDTPPKFILDAIQPASIWSATTSKKTLYQKHQHHFQFVMLARFIRRYIQIMQSGKLMDPITMRPSPSYYRTTEELKQWYALIQQQELQQQPDMAMESNSPSDTTNGSEGNVHFHICYHATRLVILYKLLEPYIIVQPDDLTLMDGLETNLALLLALQQLASRGCDQSTYHHMFFAIHNTATRIHQHHTNTRNSEWQVWAEEQLQMNLVLLKGTQAYVNDVFQMRVYAEKIEQQFAHMGLQLSDYYQLTLSLMTQHQHQQLLLQQRCMEDKDVVEKQEQNNVELSMTKNTIGSSQRHNTCHAASLDNQGANKSPSSKSKPSSLPASLPGMYVYKLHTSASIKKPRKSKIKPKITR